MQDGRVAALPMVVGCFPLALSGSVASATSAERELLLELMRRHVTHIGNAAHSVGEQQPAQDSTSAALQLAVAAISYCWTDFQPQVRHQALMVPAPSAGACIREAPIWWVQDIESCINTAKAGLAMSCTVWEDIAEKLAAAVTQAVGADAAVQAPLKSALFCAATIIARFSLQVPKTQFNRPLAGASSGGGVKLTPEAAYVLMHQPRHAGLVLEPARQAAVAALAGAPLRYDMTGFSEASATFFAPVADVGRNGSPLNSCDWA